MVMRPPLATLFESEVFYGVDDITLRTIDNQTFLRQTACWTDERPAFQIFFIAGLFSHQNHALPCVGLAKNQLGGVAIKVTSLTVFRFAAQGTE
jgi:hypothetical protein